MIKRLIDFVRIKLITFLEMLRLTKLQCLRPPFSVWDMAFVNKKHVPTRGGTKRENWARFGEKRARVPISLFF